ncbi:hypothetical protein SLS56_012210 [Neofusicoccum ribis]|uniref:Methyltransferase n=1 Tax=Neofusicoccum ribis TaxID=45134 RepID=A0ABR3S9H7_9PEZI
MCNYPRDWAIIRWAEARATCNNAAFGYDKGGLIQDPAVTAFALFARSAFAKSIIDLGSSTGKLLEKLLEPGTIVAVEILENSAPYIRYRIACAEDHVCIHNYKAESTETTLDHIVDQPGELRKMRKEYRPEGHGDPGICYDPVAVIAELKV